MLGILIVVLNATLVALPMTSMPFVYSMPVGGCADFEAYLDVASPWGISSIYVVSREGGFTYPALERYPTPKFVKGKICGDFLVLRVDRWASLGPVTPVAVQKEETVYLYQGIPLELNGTAIVKIRSLTPPSVAGQFVYRTASKSFYGVYIEEYVVYGGARITAYGIANITYISFSGDRPDFYIVVPMEGVKVEGLRSWEPEYNFMFSPNQTAAVGRPRVIVEQVNIPVVGECGGVATVVNPVARPLSVYIKLETGEEYVLTTYQIPRNISTWRLREVRARTVDGGDLPVHAVATEDGAYVSYCVLEGVQYRVYVNAGGATYVYRAAARSGVIEVVTDLVRPRVVIDDSSLAVAVEPDVARVGSNITVRVYLNGTAVAEFAVKAAPVVTINSSSLLSEIRVVDLLNSPISNFVVYVGNFKFYGRGGVAKILPIADRVAVEVNGVRYLAPLAPVVRVPTLTFESLVKIMAAAVIVGGAAAFTLGGKKSREQKERGGTIEV